MKRNKLTSIFVAALAALTLTAGPASAETNPFTPKSPPFKTAIVKYSLKGTSSGSEALYINGMEQARHTNAKTSIFGMTNEQKTITITKPKKIIQIDLVERKAVSSGNVQHYMALEYDKLNSKEKATVRKNAEGLGQNLAGMLPGTDLKKRQGKLMGKDVEILTVMGMTSYVWKDTGIMLKMSGSMGPIKVNSAATSLKTDVSLPGSAFAIPAGLKVVWDERADQQQRKMAKQWMDNLKDPEFGKKGGKSGMGAMFGGQQSPKAPRGAPAEEDSDTSSDDAMEQGMKVLKGLFD